MKFLFLTAALTIISFFGLKAQKIKVLSVNDGNYPEITVRISVQNPGQDTVCIIENGNFSNSNTINPEKDNTPSEEKTYVFLVENSYYFYHNGVFPDIKKAILSILPNISDKNSLNILYFGTPGRTIKFLSAGQTRDFKLLNANIEDYFQPQKDSSFIDNRLYQSVEAAFNYTQTHSGNGAVVLNIISRGLNLSEIRNFNLSFFETAAKSEVYINVLMYDSMSQNSREELKKLAAITGGSFNMFKAQTLEANLAQLLEKTEKTKARNYFKEITVKFTAQQRGTSNSFIIKCGNDEVLSEYTNPDQSVTQGRYAILTAIGIIILTILSAIGLYYKTRTKIIRHIDSTSQMHLKDVIKENKTLKKELEKYKKHPVSILRNFDKFAAEENLIGSGKMVPKLLIQDGEKKTIFELSKMIMTIGRKETNDIVVENRTVSSNHATLSFEGGLFYITDNNSTNGTFINDLRITKSKIYPDDIVRIGAVFAKINY